MAKLFYMGLEPYEGRYTLQLEQWNEAAFKRRGIDYEIIRGETLDNDKAIVTGQVLDAHGRSYYSLTQMANLIKKMKAGEIGFEDKIFFEDMFTPGIESLPYIMDQVEWDYRPQVYVRCLAQTIDPDDFLHVHMMNRWMALYEKMTVEFATVLASNEEMVAHMKIAGWEAPIYNISGLAFDADEVRSRVTESKPFNERKNRVVFAARFDQEKQPGFFMDLIEEYGKNNPDVEFAVLSGGPLRSNDEQYLDRARELEKTHNFKIYENLKKNEYYSLLADSKVLFNCALQDWVSNTASEADALGTNCLYPAYRSFPETFANDSECLYIPWSMEDAIAKLDRLMVTPRKRMGELSKWTSGTIDRCLDIMFTDMNNDSAAPWYRGNYDYRNFTKESKY
jgi:glycosyltransferase involved in cell wall biosynthesis